MCVHSFILILKLYYAVEIIIISLQMRTPGPREVTQSAQAHTKCK